MFRASSAHLQEDTVAHVQHMVLSLSIRVLLGVLRHPPTTFPLQSVLTQAVYRQATKNSYRVRVPYAARVQLYPSEDEHLRLETCRGEYYFVNK